jgi:hypothetical protein
MTDHLKDPSQGPADRTATTDRLLADWRDAVAKELAASDASDVPPWDANHATLLQAYEAAVEHCRHVAGQAWTTALDPAGLRLRAEIVQHAIWPDHPEDDRFARVLSGKTYDAGLALCEFDERAVAELVKAVLWTARTAPARPRPAAPEGDAAPAPKSA